MTLVSQFVAGNQSWIRLAGGIVLIVVGGFVFRSRPSALDRRVRSLDRTKTYLSTFLLALSNPMTLFAYTTAFSLIRSAHTETDRIFLPLLVAGIFFGSLSWISALLGLTSVFRKKVPATGIALVNRIAGGVLMLFGIIAVWIGAEKL